MTQEQIEKLIKIGKRKGFNAVQLSQHITQPPYNLSCAEASVIYFAYKNRYNGGSITKPTTVYPIIKPGKLPAFNPPNENLVSTAAAELAGYTPSNLNRSSVKSCALAASTRIRAGKFKRVSPSFVKQVEAELENIIRGIGGAEDSDDIPGDWDFLNRKQISSRLFEQLNRAVKKIVLRKVRSYPSKGQTLR